MMFADPHIYTNYLTIGLPMAQMHGTIVLFVKLTNGYRFMNFDEYFMISKLSYSQIEISFQF